MKSGKLNFPAKTFKLLTITNFHDTAVLFLQDKLCYDTCYRSSATFNHYSVGKLLLISNLDIKIVLAQHVTLKITNNGVKLCSTVIIEDLVNR